MKPDFELIKSRILKGIIACSLHDEVNVLITENYDFFSILEVLLAYGHDEEQAYMYYAPRDICEAYLESKYPEIKFHLEKSDLKYSFYYLNGIKECYLHHSTKELTWIFSNNEGYEIFKPDNSLDLNCFPLLEKLNVVANQEAIPKINDLKKLKHLEITFDYSKKAWPILENSNIQYCRMNDWNGGLKNITIPPNVEELRLERKLGKLVNHGLYHLTKLKKLSTFSHPKTTIQKILSHPRIEEINMNGIKEDLVILENENITILEMNSAKIIELEIRTVSLKKLVISSDTLTILSFQKECPHLHTLTIRSKELKSFDFLSNCPSLERLELYVPLELDLKKLSNFKKLKHLTLHGMKVLQGISCLKDMNLSSLSLVDIKNIYFEDISSFDIPFLEFGFIDYEIVKLLISRISAEEIRIYSTKILNLKDIKNLPKVKSFSCSNVRLDHIELLSNAINLETLRIFSSKNMFSYEFLSNLDQLKIAYLPSFLDQKDKLYHILKDKKPYKLDFEYYDTNYLDCNIEEKYLSYDILKYTNPNSTIGYYGFVYNLTEEFGKETNDEVERVIKRQLSKKEKKKYRFDSEAENFCVYTNDLNDIKLLIDLIWKLRK